MSMSDIKVKPMKVRALVEHALNGINHDRLEIRPGLSNMLMITSASRQILCSSKSASRWIASAARRLARHAVRKRGCRLT
jgi:hypothetical protein